MTSKNELLLQHTRVGNTLEVERLLNEQQCDVNYADHHGHTPLLWAVFKNRTEIVQALINANADVNYADHHGNTPLYLAAEHNNIELIDILIKHHPIIKFAHNKENIKDMSYSDIKYLVNLSHKPQLLKNIVDILSKHSDDVPNPLEKYHKLYNIINDQFFSVAGVCQNIQKDNIDKMETGIYHLPSEVICQITSYLQLEDINMIGISSE